MGNANLLTTAGRKISEEQVKEQTKKIGIVEDFIKDIEKFGGKDAVPKGLTKAVDRYLLAMKMGLDAAEAANEVSRELEAIYEDMYTICRKKVGIKKSQPRTMEQADQLAICEARVDRQWQSRNLKKVLNWNEDSSWIRKLFDKWRDRLLSSMDFMESERQYQNLPAGVKPRPQKRLT